MAVLFNAGDQLPVIPLVDVVGKAGSGSPAHIGATALNAGVTFGLTVTVYVVVVPHCPLFGVNVYTPLAVLLTVAGLQVPVIPFEEVAGKVTTEAPAQIVVLVPKEKVGTILGLTVTCNVVPNTHPGPVALKV